MRKIKVRFAALLAALALVMTGCNLGGGGSTPYYDTICVDPFTHIRVLDLNCQAGWLYYVPPGYYAPAYGVLVPHYSTRYYHRPAGATIHYGGISRTGGKATHFSSGNYSVGKSGKVSLIKPGKVSLIKPNRNTYQKPTIRQRITTRLGGGRR